MSLYTQSPPQRDLQGRSDESSVFCIINDAFCIINDAFCINNDELCIKIDGLCIENDELCTKIDGLRIENDESCTKNDEFCINFAADSPEQTNPRTFIQPAAARTPCALSYRFSTDFDCFTTDFDCFMTDFALFRLI